MKKWRNLLFVTLGLAFCVGFSCACASKQAVMVRAEGEVTFEQKTYVYEDENGKAILVLLSETEFSLTIGEETKNGTYTKNGNILTLAIDESFIDVEINDILGTFGEPTIVEEQSVEEKSWFQKNYETYVVPLLSGVSITSILSMVVTIVFTSVKNKKLDQKVLAITEKANEKYQYTEDKLVEVKEILKEVHEIYQLTLNNEKVNSEAKTFLQEKVKYMVSVVDGNSEKVNKIDDLVKILTLLTQLQIKVSKQSAEIVKSGIIEDINEITQLVKKL